MMRGDHRDAAAAAAEQGRAPAAPGLRRAGAVRRLWQCAEGAMQVEFAIIITFFVVPLLVAVYDFGTFSLQWANLRAAASAGTHYGIQNQTNAQQSTVIEAAARVDADDPTLTVSSRSYCMCPGETTESGCTTTCADNEYNIMYFEVTASRDVDFVISYPGLTNPFPMSVTSTVRVR